MASSPVKGIGALVIGDELLSGKRTDAHLGAVLERLAPRGLELAWVHYAGDEPLRLTRFLRDSLAGDDIVFGFGGIGATPDDRTRQCVAEASGHALVAHPGAIGAIEAQFGDAARPNRIRMADLPEGSELVPNPVNRVPGFSLGDHHFLPGFPSMAWPMLEWVLDHRYPNLVRSLQPERLLYAAEAHESELLELMEALVAGFPGVRLSSLPHVDGEQRHIEFGLRGEARDVDAAFSALVAGLEQRGVRWKEQ